MIDSAKEPTPVARYDRVSVIGTPAAMTTFICAIRSALPLDQKRDPTLIYPDPIREDLSTYIMIVGKKTSE